MSLVATVGPSAMNIGETLSTLVFASRCMSVTVNPTQQVEVDYAALCARLQAQVGRLEAEAADRMAQQAMQYEGVIRDLQDHLSDVIHSSSSSSTQQPRGRGNGSRLDDAIPATGDAPSSSSSYPIATAAASSSAPMTARSYHSKQSDEGIQRNNSEGINMGDDDVRWDSDSLNEDRPTQQGLYQCNKENESEEYYAGTTASTARKRDRLADTEAGTTHKEQHHQQEKKNVLSSMLTNFEFLIGQLNSLRDNSNSNSSSTNKSDIAAKYDRNTEHDGISLPEGPDFRRWIEIFTSIDKDSGTHSTPPTDTTNTAEQQPMAGTDGTGSAVAASSTAVATTTTTTTTATAATTSLTDSFGVGERTLVALLGYCYEALCAVAAASERVIAEDTRNETKRGKKAKTMIKAETVREEARRREVAKMTANDSRFTSTSPASTAISPIEGHNSGIISGAQSSDQQDSYIDGARPPSLPLPLPLPPSIGSHLAKVDAMYGSSGTVGNCGSGSSGSGASRGRGRGSDIGDRENIDGIGFKDAKRKNGAPSSAPATSAAVKPLSEFQTLEAFASHLTVLLGTIKGHLSTASLLMRGKDKGYEGVKRALAAQLVEQRKREEGE
jgi:hypothetical protein